MRGKQRTEEQIEKERLVKRINERVRTIGESDMFGKNSPEFERAQNNLRVAVKDIDNALTENGYIRRNTDVLDQLSMDQLYGMLNIRGARQIEKEYEKGAAIEYGTEKPTKAEVQEYRQTVNLVDNLIKEYSGLVSAAVRAYDLHGQNSSVEDWKEAMIGMITDTLPDEARERLEKSKEKTVIDNYFDRGVNTYVGDIPEGEENYDPSEA